MSSPSSFCTICTNNCKQELEYVTNRSQLNEYNKINSLLLSPSKSIDNYNIQARYLFFDIFAYNKVIYLICPVYTKNYINYDDIKLSYNNVTLKTKATHNHLTGSPGFKEPIISYLGIPPIFLINFLIK